MLYGGENLVPIAVPRFYLSIFFPNVNMLFFNTTSAKSMMVSFETYFVFGFRVVFLDRTSSWGIFGYNPTTSIIHKVMPSARAFLKNSLVSFTYLYKIWPLELVIVNDGPGMRKYF